MLSVEEIIGFTDYSSEFNSDVDSVEIDGDFDWEQFQPTPTDYDQLEASATEWAEEFGYEFETEIRKDETFGNVNAIISVTGDDEVITTESLALCFLHFAAAVHTNGITVSKKDTGVSYTLGNYTEGWIVLPPNAEADHASVNRRHKRNGVATTFDITKLKATSAVRKQSSKDLDFESKFGQLHKAAEWTDPDWFTYDYAQMCLVLASAIFDFTSCRVFPYLFQQEGGCGGKPPWNNVDTAISALSFFNAKKSMTSILAVMDEATQVQLGRLSPQNAVYIHASHYAQVGDSALSRIIGARNFLSRIDPDERAKCLDLCKGQTPLPNELLKESVIVCPKDKLLGSAIAELRSNGLIMTELDVRLKQLGGQKFFDLLKDKNMGLVREEREAEKIAIKKSGFNELAKLSSSDVRVQSLEPHAVRILSAYYKMRSDISDITGFSYEGQIRVFKTVDVQSYYERSNFGLADEMVSALGSYKGFKLGQKLGQAKTDLEYQIGWMETGHLQDLFEGEIPPSIGSDDARIGRKILKEIEDLEPHERVVFVIVTNDVALVRDLNLLLISRENIRISQLKVLDYVKDSVRNHKNGRIKLKNMFSSDETYYPSVFNCIINTIPWGWKKPYFKVLWDFPNINRSVEGLRIRAGKLYKTEGGYLRRETSRNLEGWSSMQWNQFKALSDFERHLRQLRL